MTIHRILATLLSVSSIFLSSLVQAQEGFHFGLVSGFHRSYVQDDFVDDSPAYKGVRKFASTGLGLAVGYHFSENVGLKAEIFSNEQGQSWDFFDRSGATPVKQGELVNYYRYLVLPAYLNVKGKKGFFRLNFQLGAQYTALLRGYEVYTLDQGMTSDFLSSNKSVDNARYGLRSSDIQAIIGLGFNLHINKELYLSLLGRINYGFFDMRDDAFKQALRGGQSSAIYRDLRRTGFTPRNNYGYLIQIGAHYSPF